MIRAQSPRAIIVAVLILAAGCGQGARDTGTRTVGRTPPSAGESHVPASPTPRTSQPKAKRLPTTRLIFLNGRDFVSALPSQEGAKFLGKAEKAAVAVAATSHYVYWLHAVRTLKVARWGKSSKTLVGDVGDGVPALLAHRGYIYWESTDGIGRIKPDGQHLNRSYIVLPKERTGGVAESIAASGNYFFFAQCSPNRIGRISFRQNQNPTITWITTVSCPTNIAVNRGHIYWLGQFDSGTFALGRVDLDGSHSTPRWLVFHTHATPAYLVADGSYLYWNWQEPPPPGADHAARVRTDRKQYAPHFRVVGNGAMTAVVAPSN